VAESADDKRRVDTVVTTASAIALASGFAAAIILTPFAQGLSIALTGSARYSVLVLLILWSFPLNNLAGVIGYVIQGLADIGRLTWANVATSVATLALVVGLTVPYRLLGAMVSVLVASFAQAALFAWALAGSYRARSWPLPRAWFATDVARTLLRYGGVMILAGAAMWGSVLVNRTIAVHSLGEYQNGIYQVAFGLSTQYMTVYMTWMAAYVFPRVTRAVRGEGLSSLLNSGLRANLFLMVPALALVIALRDPLIRIFYSGAFVSASPLLPIQVLGDYARVIGWSFGVSLFAQGRTAGYLFAVVAQAVTWVGLVAILLPLLGVSALVVGYSVSSLLWPALMYPMTRGWFGVKISSDNALLAALGLAVLGGCTLLPQPFGLVLVPVLPAIVFLRRRDLSLS
jgi:O-antigen/teichoic acid export membrane protein